MTLWQDLDELKRAIDQLSSSVVRLRVRGEDVTKREIEILTEEVQYIEAMLKRLRDSAT
jgi:hypothetical protein